MHKRAFAQGGNIDGGKKNSHPLWIANSFHYGTFRQEFFYENPKKGFSS
jgi:hypothetical protein